MQNHTYENEFRSHIHFHANQTQLHVKGFIGRLGLKQRHKVTPKWPIMPTVSEFLSLLRSPFKLIFFILNIRVMLRAKMLCHIRYINILTWLRGFQYYLVISFVSKCLLGREGQKKLENFKFCSESLGAMLWIYRTWHIVTPSCPVHFPLLFCLFRRFTYISTHLFNSYWGKLTWTLVSGQTEF